MGRRGVLVALLALGAALACAPAAMASSLVFAAAGDLYTSPPDGTKIRLLANGAEDFHAPSVAPDGTIWAVYGTRIAHLSPNGQVVLHLLAPAAPVVDVAVSPDGTRIAYTTQDAVGTSTTFYARADGTGGEADFGGGQVGFGGPSWLDANRVLLDRGAAGVADNVAVDTVDAAAPATWLATESGGPFQRVEGDVNASLAFAAWVVPNKPAPNAGPSIVLYKALGGPPTNATSACSFPAPGANDPAWSPDGGSLAWGDDTGIWTVAVPTLDGSCASLSAFRVLPAGAREPDWSPLDFDLSAAPLAATSKARLTGLALAAKAFPAATGTTLAGNATSAGTLTMTTVRLGAGLKKGRGCVASTRKGKKLQRCVLRTVVGDPVPVAVPGGAFAVAYLRPDLTKGAYEVAVTLTDLVGRVSVVKRLPFRIQ